MSSIGKDLVNKVHQHARESYPYECCGIIIGTPGTVEDDTLFRCTNVQDKLHAMDPVTYPRDARTAYSIDAKEQMTIEKEARERGLAIKTFYHSHPDHGAYFSDEDKRMALFGEEPWYPNATHWVISVHEGQIKDQALFTWNPESKIFERKTDFAFYRMNF